MLRNRRARARCKRRAAPQKSGKIPRIGGGQVYIIGARLDCDIWTTKRARTGSTWPRRQRGVRGGERGRDPHGCFGALTVRGVDDRSALFLKHSGLAQLVEQAAVNRRVAGSSPAVGATSPLLRERARGG